MLFFVKKISPHNNPIRNPLLACFNIGEIVAFDNLNDNIDFNENDN